jgi:hypothetical protein
MVKFRDVDSHIPTSKFRTSKIDLAVPGQIECNKITDATSIDLVTPTLNVSGNVFIGDDQFVKFGQNGSDMSIGHDPETNLIAHAKQLQFRSQMTSGDSYKFLETLRRDSTWLFSTDNASGAEKTNAYFFYGNDDSGATNSTFFKHGIRAADNSGLQVVSQIRQEGSTLDSASITNFCPTTFENDVLIKDNNSLFLGDSKDFQIIHDAASGTFVDEQGTGELFMRTNGPAVSIRNLTDNSYIASFNREGSCDLYHNANKKLSTTDSGISITPEGSAPANNATGTAGQIILHGDYIYVCIATDTWKRAHLSNY